MRNIIGIDIGGTNIKHSLINEKGSVLFEGLNLTKAETTTDEVIGQVKKSISEVLSYAKEHNLLESIAGIGIGTPGIIDKTAKIIIGGADNIVGWENLPLGDIIEKEFNLKTLLINDANAMGVAELKFGAGKGSDNIIFLTVGTGIGGAIVINGEIFSGYNNRGSELGHIPLIADGIPCSCGSVGCFEAYASTSALVSQFQDEWIKSHQHLDQVVDGRLIVKLFHENNLVATSCMDKHFDFLGRGIAGLVNIFSPQKVIIGGGISESGDFYLQNIKEYFDKYVMKDCAANTVLVLAELGNKAGMIGAASYILSYIEK